MAEAAVASAQAPLTHARVFRIAFPIVLSNATIPILGVVDTAVVGQMGTAAPIGAVGIGAFSLAAVYWIFGFLRMGTVGLASQAIGAGDRPEADAILSRALMIGLSAGLALIALQIPIFWGVFAVAPASDEVETLARGYMEIRIWSAPAAIAVFALTGWLIAAERTRAVLAIQVWMNGLNIALNVVFVLGFGWGVNGVAVATFIAEWSGLALGLWFCRDAFARPGWRDWPRVFDAARLRRMASVNTDILIRSVLLEAILVSFMFIGSDFGDVPLAANQILMQFLMVTAYAMDGFAFAAETLVGQAMGARARGRLRQSAVMAGMWAAGICVLLAAVFALAGPAIIDVMTTAPDVRAETRVFLLYMVAAPILGCAAWMLDGIFIGATRTRDMRDMMLVSALIYAAAALILVPAFGNHGLWAALLISFVARGVTLGLKYPALERAAGA
ncbi:MATE family efflux transporter [Palleronia sp. KMU-117]|uniref:MATE family efflux transporter n=1 Tax=Palleronia sp. KMU-117 TaxID=3434108 RepID=UPI003D755ED3